MSARRKGTSIVEWGEFFCPTCRQKRKYVKKELWQTTGAGGTKVDTLKMAGQFIECAVCGDTFDPGVLSRHPDEDPRPLDAIYRELMLKVMVVMMETDGRIFNDEVLRICDIYEEIIGFRLPDRILEEEINAARSTERDAFDHVRSYSGRINPQGMEKVLRAAYHVAMADETFGAKEKDFLTSLGVAMGMSLKQIDEVLEAVKREGHTDFGRPK
ncbi:MAG: TerB family tellurite resistance protein [Rhodothermales bacterium]|jgi:tellurite resistance protein